jgi:hypothetical protein
VSKLTARGFGAVSNSPSPLDTQSPAAPVFDGVCRLIANHHDLAIFESAPEVRGIYWRRLLNDKFMLAPTAAPAPLKAGEVSTLQLWWSRLQTILADEMVDAVESNQAYHNEVDGDDEVQQPRHDQD